MTDTMVDGKDNGACYQNRDVWIVENDEYADKLKRTGFNVLVVQPDADDLTDKQLSAVNNMDAILFADVNGSDGWVDHVRPLIFGFAKSIKVELFDNEEAKREMDADKRMAGLESELLNIIQMNNDEYEIHRKIIAKRLDVRVTWLDEQRKIATREDACGSDDVVENIEPWLEPVDGDELLSEIVNQIGRHIVLPDGSAVAIGLWIILTYCYDCFRTLPILSIVSPQKRCGKTTTLEVITGLSCRVLPASNISSAAVFRSIEKFKPTLIIDEADSFLKDNEELRGVLNSGHTRATAFVVRCDGESNDPKKFSTWSPKAIAAIGQLPGTIADRSIIIKLRRKSSNEHREKIGHHFEHRALTIRRMCLRWAIDNDDFLRSNRHEIQIKGNDRATDNWASLATIANAVDFTTIASTDPSKMTMVDGSVTTTVGGNWIDRLKKSAHLIMGDGAEQADDLPVLLLQDIKEIFKNLGSERIHSANLVNLLNGLEERPWTDLKGGKGLSSNVLARFLSPFEIKSKNLRIGVELKKGYELETFKDAFNRYIPSDPPEQTVTPSQINKINKLSKKQSVTSNDTLRFKNDDKHLKSIECYGVTDKKGVAGKGIPINRDDEVIV